MPIRLKISCQINELPTIAGYIIESYTRDRADFFAYSPTYNETFLSNLKSNTENLQSLINPKQITAELKTITARIYQNQIVLRHPIDLIEGYINRASNLTMKPSEFGISSVRSANNKGNIEGVLCFLNYLLSNIKKNYAALKAKGLKADLLDNLQSLYNKILEDNIAQNLKISERKALVQRNYEAMNHLWDTLVDICDIGKKLYKTSGTNKWQDYSIRKRIALMRLYNKKTKIFGKVTLNSVPVSNAYIDIQPIDGESNKRIKLNLDATFIRLGIPQGIYKATCFLVNTIPQTEYITLKTKKNLERNFNLHWSSN